MWQACSGDSSSILPDQEGHSTCAAGPGLMSRAPGWPCHPAVPFHTNRGAGCPTGNPLLGTCTSLSVPLWPEAPTGSARFWGCQNLPTTCLSLSID